MDTDPVPVAPCAARLVPESTLVALSAERLQERLRALTWGGRQLLVSFLAHLQEFDRRKAYAPLGYDSLFRYCTTALGLSEDEACIRILAARLAMRFPEVLGMLARGETHLSKLAKLSPHLTEENASALLKETRGKSRREVERIATCLGGGTRPALDCVRFLPTAEVAPSRSAPEEDFASCAPAQSPPSTILSASSEDSSAPATGGLAESPPAAAPDSPSSAPQECREPRLVRISFTAPEALLDKIERARALLRHKHPEGRLEQLADEAFEALLEARDPDRRRPARRRAPNLGASGRRIPRRVKDLVWRRDEGRCAFVAPDGMRCASTSWLEYDHVLPFALGGRSDDTANVRLLCRTHNQMAARTAFGAAAIEGAVQRSTEAARRQRVQVIRTGPET